VQEVLKTMALGLALAVVFAAGPGWAQTAPPAQPPATPPATQKPAEVAPPSKAPMPFLEGAKIAFVNFDYVAANSEDGKAMIAKIQAMQKTKTAELAEMGKKLEAARKKAVDQASVMNDQARAQAEREISRLERDLQSAQQDATADFNAFSQKAQNEFGQKVVPLLQALAKEKGLHVVLRAVTEVIAWAHDGVDLSDELVKRLNESAKTPPKK
jgi:Skp family chaperone for outer membrane proteins